MVNRFLQLAKTMLKPIRKFIYPLFLSVVLFFGLLASSLTTSTGLRHALAVTAGKEKNFNYDFSLKDFSGKKIAFSEFKGKVLFINLWATWCGPCRSEMPTIQSLYNAMSSDEVKFVMLSLDTEKTINNIPGYIKSNQYSFPVFSPSGYLPDQFQVSYIPVTYIVSKQGKIVMTLTGGTDFTAPKYKKLLEEEAAK